MIKAQKRNVSGPFRVEKGDCYDTIDDSLDFGCKGVPLGASFRLGTASRRARTGPQAPQNGWSQIYRELKKSISQFNPR